MKLVLFALLCVTVVYGRDKDWREWEDKHTSTDLDFPDVVDAQWSERVCTFTTEWGYSSQKCCPGWTGSIERGCPTPICNSQCQNNGRCINPDVCQCQPGYTGKYCQSIRKGLCWTDWMDSDDPYYGDGDDETLPKLRKEYAVCKHTVPEHIECETTGGIPVVGRERNNVECNRRSGLTCRNTPKTTCEDYRVRLLCPCQKTGNTKTCTHHGKEFNPQETIQEECNTCTCVATGQWSCTEEDCKNKNTGTNDPSDRFGICLYGSKRYRTFDRISHGNSRCTCLHSGGWECTSRHVTLTTGQCATIDGELYENNDILDNDCNKCVCYNGEWKCTSFLCPPLNPLSEIESMCYVQDATYHEGSIYRRDCNICVCTQGRWDCSKDTCNVNQIITHPKTCTNLDGVTYADGLIVNRDCNACMCVNGVWACTRRYCEPNVYPDTLCVDTMTGAPVRSGHSIAQDCNICVCNSGSLTCTDFPCSVSICVEQQRKYDNSSPLPGSYRPSCNADGSFASVQCTQDNKLCFCVDRDGNRIPGTFSTEATPNCSPYTAPVQKTDKETDLLDATTTNCETQRKISESTPGLYPPQCESNGRYSPMQCNPGTWICHCVDINGITIPATVTHVSEGMPDCEQYREFNMQTMTPGKTLLFNITANATTTPCSIARNVSSNLGLPAPSCEADGTFSLLQCTSEMCYCVNMQGVLITDTVTPIGPNVRRVKLECENYRKATLITSTPRSTGPQSTNTVTDNSDTTTQIEPCFRHQELARTLSITPMVCYPNNGTFVPLQSTQEISYCVDINGVTIPGTVTVIPAHGSIPNCELYRQFALTSMSRTFDMDISIVTPITFMTHLGPQTMFIIPIPDTTVSPIVLPDNLQDTNTLPKCTRMQLIAMTMGVPTPTCESDGRFTPLQCTRTTCSCVDTEGMTLDITEVRPGFTKIINRTYCESFRNVTITPVNSTLSKNWGPKSPCFQHIELANKHGLSTLNCSIYNGTFIPRQVRRTNITMCVDVNGVTIPGSVFKACRQMRPSNYCDVYRHVNLTEVMIPIPNPVIRPFTTVTPYGPQTLYVVPESPLMDSLLPLINTTTPVLDTITYTQTMCNRMSRMLIAFGIDHLFCHPENGTFSPMQCKEDICTCVDTQGMIIPGMLKLRHQLNCEKYRNVTLTSPNTVQTTVDVTETGAIITTTKHIPVCTKHRQLARQHGIEPLTCHSENGTFTPLQCWENVCYCVDINGVTIPRTVTLVDKMGRPSCEQFRYVNLSTSITVPPMPLLTPVTVQKPEGPTTVWNVPNYPHTIATSPITTKSMPHCRKQQLIAELMGAEPAQCNKDGTFIPQQTINNVTYCVDVWGTVLVHTITPMYPGTPVPSLKCQDFSAVDITPAYSSSSIENPAVEQRCLKQGHMTRDLNLWHLTCHSENGTFNPYQEYNSAAFCVDLKGVLIPGTMTPLTSTTKRPNCEIYRMVNLCTSAASLPMPKVLPSVTALTSFLPTGPEVNYVPGAPAETIDTTTTPTCIKMQEVAMAMGVKPPTCHANSTFTPLQCTSKVCYCIDTQGTIIPGTAAPITPYTKTLTLVCDKYWNVTIVNTTGTAVTMATTATHGITEKRDTICYSTMRTTTNMALPSMQCEAENGTFTPLQSTNNVYYCVDVQGRTIPGTVTPITKTTYIPNCEIFRNVNLTTTSAVPPIPVAIPVITPMSIPTSMGQRVVYTVPESTIKQTTVTTTAPIVVPIVENTNLRPCFRMHQILTMMNKDNKLPDCKPNGYFEPLQCDRYVCACLDVNNVIIPETITPTWNTPPTCSQYATVSVINTNDTTVVTKTNPLAALLPEGMNKITNFGPCTRHQHIMKKLGFRTSLTCLQNGTFSPLQQHNDLSWCVDRDGRTIPYTVNFNIEGSSPPNCEPFRGVSMNTTIIGSMILNPLVKPVVTEVSLMTPTGTEKIQAVVTTTIATDSTEIPDIFTIPEETFNITFNWDTPTKVVAVTIMTTNGTQTIYTLKQTTNSTSNATNPIIVPIVTNTSLSPCTHQKQIAKMLGVSGPLCETDNTFKPLQCYNSVCRCVDQKGVTIPGTITRLDTESFVREPECQQYKHLTLINTTVTNVTKTTRKIMTETMATAVGPCTRHQWIATTLGLKKMNCNAKSGTFSPVQCDDEVCYCVDHFGVTIPGTFHYTTAAQMTTVCEPYRNVNLNTTINNTVIFSSTLQPIVRNFTILTASGVTTMWAIPMTVYDGSDAVAANTTATYLLLNTPTGPQSVLTTKSLPANAVPTRNTTDNSNMTTDYTTTIQLPTGPVTIRVKTHASTNTTSYINYSLTIVDVGVTKPLELFTETKTAYPTQQFVVTPYETVHVNTEKLFDLSVSRFTDPKFGTFPFINTTHSQTVANENPGNNKLTPVTVITPNGPITVMMPDITPLTTLDTTKTTTDADTTVLPMTVMTPIGVKTIWTVVSTTASKIMDYIPVKPIIVSIVSNTTQPPCFHQTQVAKGLNAVEPTCESTGYFTPLQCIKGNCYCVDVNGVVIAETIIPTYVGVKPQCERYRTVSVLNTTHPNIIIKTKHIPHPWNMNIKKTFTEVSGPCKRHRIIANKLGLQSSLNCHEENGTFTPLQCPDTDTCYCVDSMGVTIPGTITSVSVNTPVPQCEQYRTLNMNTTSSGTLLLPPHVQPIVTNTTIMTPTGIRSVFTPVLTHMTTYNNLTNNFTLYANMTTNTTTQLPFNLPVNVTANATLNTPYTFPTNVTVMTPNGSKTVNVMVTVIITNATIMSSALSSTNVPYKPLNSPIPTAIRIPLIPTMTLSTPWGHRQWEDKLTTPVWTTPFASSPITSPFMNPWTTPFSTLTRTAPVTATDTCYSPVLYSLAIPSDISTTSEMKPWFMQYLVINYLNFTGPLDYSHTHVTGMIKDAVPYTGLTPYEPMTVFSLHASLPMNMIDTRISSNITATLTQKVRDTTTYPVTFMTPFGSMTRWMPVFSFTWYTNMTQSSVLPVVTPLTITTKTGLEVIYTAQPPAELKLSDTTPPMILPFVINTTQAPCTNLQHIAKLLGVIPPTCHEDGTFTTSQCTGQICYCVDSVGVLIASTVIAHRRPYCHPYKSVTLINTTITNITTEVTMSANHHPVTKAVGPCTRHQRIARSYGLTTMDCHAENGTFIPSQCVDSVCYCVDRNGVTVPGTPTVVTPYNPAPNCQLYRNVDLNLMYNGTIMLNPTTIPVVREVSVVTPSGPKTVWTPITTDMTPNTSDKLMTFQMTTRNTTTARQVTVMTAKGVQTIWANVPWTILPFTVHSSINTTTNTTNTNSTQTPACIRQTQIAHEVHGVVKPICSPITGEYEKLQYNPVTGTYYCVDINGVIIPNTVTPSILPEPSCELYGNVTLNVNATGNYTWANATGSTSCWQQRKSALATPGKFVPFCEPNGTFTPLQCNPNTGYCFCVDPAGHVVPKTVTHVTRGTPACWAFHGNVSNSTAARTSQRPANYWKTLCQTQQQLYQPIPGSFYPRCNANGGFSPVQCHDSAGYCYCVTKDGAPIPGSTTTIGIPDCSSYTSVPAPTTTSKDCHTAQSLYDRSSKIHAGAVRPWCEVEGTYSPIQCHVGLGYCFCVDPKTGAEIPGTETRGRPDCTPRITPKSPVEIVEKDYDCYDDKGKGYERGERLYRRCNKCWCRPGGEFVCTKKRCQSNVCYENGRRQKDGSTKRNDCNTCTCMGGAWVCTLKACTTNQERQTLAATTTTTTTTHTGTEQIAACPSGQTIEKCPYDPCEAMPICRSNPLAVCIPNDCAGCERVFYDLWGKQVKCQDWDE